MTKKYKNKINKKGSATPQNLINRVENWKKRFDYQNTDIFFWKSININELMYTAIDDLLYQIYYANADVQRAIADKNNLIFESWYLFKNKKWETISTEKTNRFNDILNNHIDFEDFKKEFNYYRNIFWNVYTYILEDNDWRVVWIQNLDPRFIYPHFNDFWFVTHYWYLNMELEKSRIIHFKNWFDPNQKYKGMSPLVWGILDILWDNEAARSNFMFFLNNAIPASLIKFSEDVDAEDIKIIMKQMNEKFSWWNNQHKIWALQWVEWVEKLQKDYKDMEYKILRDFSTEKIATCLWVPLTRLNKINVTYNNMKEAFEQYVEATILNEEKDFETHLNKILKYTFYFDDIKIEAINDHVDNTLYYTDIYIKQIENWIITPAFAAEKLWYEIKDEENQDKIYMKNWLLKIEDIWMPLTQTDFNLWEIQ